MPNRDGTGPDGKGPRTGKYIGDCPVKDDSDNSSQLQSRGMGMGRRGRPCSQRRVRFSPDITFFKPQGVPIADLEIVDLSSEELEVLRLKNMKKLDQKECAKLMETSPATVQRILSSAYLKITLALVEGRAMRISE